jgi:hypothetical protein
MHTTLLNLGISTLRGIARSKTGLHLFVKDVALLDERRLARVSIHNSIVNSHSGQTKRAEHRTMCAFRKFCRCARLKASAPVRAPPRTRRNQARNDISKTIALVLDLSYNLFALGGEMKHKVGIVHGAGGSPSINWFPWLSGELSKLGHSVIAPELPGLSEQSLSSWRDVFLSSYGELTDTSILIGHSIGCGLVLNLLNEIQRPIHAAFFTAGFIGAIGNSTYDPPNASFFWLVARSRSHT